MLCFWLQWNTPNPSQTTAAWRSCGRRRGGSPPTAASERRSTRPWLARTPPARRRRERRPVRWRAAGVRAAYAMVCEPADVSSSWSWVTYWNLCFRLRGWRSWNWHQDLGLHIYTKELEKYSDAAQPRGQTAGLLCTFMTSLYDYAVISSFLI